MYVNFTLKKRKHIFIAITAKNPFKQLIMSLASPQVNFQGILSRDQRHESTHTELVSWKVCE